MNVCGRSVISRRISRKSPEAASRPATITSTLLGQPLDLLEDVRGEQDRPALGGHPPEQLHHVQPLARVHPVERLVEQQDRRLVDERRGDLRPLAHPLRVGADRAVGGVLEIDRRDRARGGGRPGRGSPGAAR